jgi:hypothetical protein
MRAQQGTRKTRALELVAQEQNRLPPKFKSLTWLQTKIIRVAQENAIERNRANTDRPGRAQTLGQNEFTSVIEENPVERQTRSEPIQPLTDEETKIFCGHRPKAGPVHDQK